MVVVTSYTVAVILCVVTMLCWGSWANTQKLASREWRFQLYYWDYAIGVLILTLIFAFTLGSMGAAGRSFLDDLSQASMGALGSAFLGGALFNLANILLVAAIDIAGMAVAFPIGIGIALVQGVIVNYLGDEAGNPYVLFLGVAFVAVAIVVNAVAYRKLPSEGQKTTRKGIGISVVAGVLMGFFYRFVAAAIAKDYVSLEFAGKLTPYTALVAFGVGLVASNFLWNTLVMRFPFTGDPIPLGNYVTKGNARLHLIGILGGLIWGVGMSLNIVAGDVAGFAIAYGLGQGATLVAAFWGVFIWKEFRAAPAGTGRLLAAMFAAYVVGLALIVIAKVAGQGAA
jgi:glucose uptake protein